MLVALCHLHFVNDKVSCSVLTLAAQIHCCSMMKDLIASKSKLFLFVLGHTFCRCHRNVERSVEAKGDRHSLVISEQDSLES